MWRNIFVQYHFVATKLVCLRLSEDPCLIFEGQGWKVSTHMIHFDLTRVVTFQGLKRSSLFPAKLEKSFIESAAGFSSVNSNINYPSAGATKLLRT